MSKQNGDRGQLTYLHHITTKSISGDKKVIHEEKVVHNERGISFSYFHKEGTKEEKYKGRKNADGTYVLMTFAGGKKDEITYSKADLLKELKKIKVLKFVSEYVEAKGGRRKSRSKSRSGSKKSSKRTSRKASRRGSKRTSRKRASRK